MQSLGVRTTQAVGAALGLLVPFGGIAALVAGKWSGLREIDTQVADRLHEAALGHAALVDALAWWSLAFDPNTWRAAALVLAIWLVRRRERMLAWWVVATMAAGGALGGVLKLLFGRHRPDLLDPVARATGYSFPSGHALNNALGAAVFLLVLLPRTRGRAKRAALVTAAVAIPLITAYTRVALGVHWTSDVVAGLLLGAAVPAITVAVFQRRRVRVEGGRVQIR
ncbi:phosphatidic acid phosphatase [Actinoplanes sp. SE50]|uniref:phosphatase PAP2 family protein n=1 Tax=unclassified Actinoplanes TaxID=2626549 RepID=UPI00023ECEF1|nr:MULTISPECIES: phosphatase PAP2 family protein [unclassified Actinoplanes]AEV86053.1 Phosphatidic acid phosphatase type 2 domain-containing protein 1B [Actinoplanes sp. SE50/110]ATO84451.1 phosphatidic acid phosphatase [Actinoplanes sp. SE50]SLM01861.1 phosphatidic acid phosphatase [Actinoplanes sp. SE50/110]